MNALIAPACGLAMLVAATSLACSASTDSPAGFATARSPATLTLPGGTTLEVDLTDPAVGAVYAAASEVRVAGTVAVGAADDAPRTTLVYVLDASASSADSASCGEGGGTVLRCEVLAAGLLNDRAAALGTVGAVGVVGFAAWGAAADMSPLPGDQLVTALTADLDHYGGRDVDQVLASISPADTRTGTMGRIGLFTRLELGYTTNLTDGLEEALCVVAAGNLPTSTIVFLSDGNDTYGGATTPEVPAGVTIHAFAIGGRGCGSVDQREPSLAWIASLGAEGSSCTSVDDVAELSVLLPAAVAPRLTAVSATVDGAPVGPATLTTTLPAAGPATVGFELTVPPLSVGRHEICVSATGGDAGGEGTATECTTVSVASITLAPATATLDLDLGVATRHEVVATVSAAGAGVAGVDIAFEIVNGPNAGATSVISTGASGTAAFGYARLTGAAGVGTDVIRACFADALDAVTCAEATATWQGDVSPPEAVCLPGPNPAGTHAPAPAARLLKLLASDEVDPAPTVFLRDSGSGATHGPFRSGTTVKYTLAPDGAPSARKIGGPRSAVALHVIGSGPPEVVATDASGNTFAAPCGGE